MRVLLVAPHSLGEPRGNSVTLVRLAAGLRKVGARVKLWGPNEPIPRGRYDIVHAFHATKAGPQALALAACSGAAPVVTLTGTDINQDLRDSDRRRVVSRVLDQARALIAFNTAARTLLRRQSSSWAGKTRIIPAAVAPSFFACGVGHKG